MSRKVLAILISLAVVFCTAFAAPLSAQALVYPSWPTQEEIDAETERLNIPTPKNLRVAKTTETSITIKWKYEDWGYNALYTTDPDEEPQWPSEFTSRTNGSTADWQHTFENLTCGTTYYIYVRHATFANINSHLICVGGEYSKLTVKLKADNTLSVKASTKSVKKSALKNNKKTVKPLKINNAKGTVNVSKIKDGTTASIYKKITVNKKTGAITLKKGKYKKGTYKIKLKINAKGNSKYKAKTVKKTVKIKIK